MIFLELFLSFLQIGLFSIGGGYAALPLIQNQVVDLKGWLTLEQFADVIAIAEMTPGPIAINAATFVGIQCAGLPGAVVATLGCIVPSSIIVLTLAYIYTKYRDIKVLKSILSLLRVAVVAMIINAAISIALMAVSGNGSSAFDYIALYIAVLAFLAIRVLKLSPIRTIFLSGGLYLIIGLIVGK